MSKLINAVITLNYNECKDLLENEKVDVNEMDPNDTDQRTAVAYICRLGDVKICKLLIDHKASINSVNRYNGSALMYATAFGHTDIVELLLKSSDDIDVNKIGKNGYSTLEYATKFGYNDITKLLLKCDNIQIDSEMNFYNACVIQQNEEICKLLVQHKKFQITNDNHYQICEILAYACMNEYHSICKIILNRFSSNININATDKDGKSILQYAYHNDEIFQLLIDMLLIEINYMIHMV